MSFIIDRLSTIRSADKALNMHGVYMYRTTDARATVLAANYFRDAYTLVPDTTTATKTSTAYQDCSAKWYVGDVIEVEQVADTTDYRPVDSYRVMIVNATTGGSAVVYVEELLEDEIVALGQLADVSTASNVDIAFGSEVELTQVATYLGGAITVGNAAITVKEDSSSGTAVDGGAVTVAYSGSAAGDRDTASPYSNRTATTFNVATDGGSTGTQTLDIVLRGRPTKGKVEVVRVDVTDISTGTSNAVACPYSGTIKKIVGTLQAAITGGDAVLTCKIGSTVAGATNITNGAFTVANSSSAIGDIDSATPTAANVVAEGDLLVVTSDGGSTNVAAEFVDFYILRS